MIGNSIRQRRYIEAHLKSGCTGKKGVSTLQQYIPVRVKEKFCKVIEIGILQLTVMVDKEIR